MAVGDYVPLMYALGLLLFIGLCVPFVLSFFVNVDDVEPSALASNLIDLVEDGIEIDLPLMDPFNFNPFDLLGTTLQGALVNSLTYLGLLPNFLVTFIIIMCVIAMIYTIIKLVPFFG